MPAHPGSYAVACDYRAVRLRLSRGSCAVFARKPTISTSSGAKPGRNHTICVSASGPAVRSSVMVTKARFRSGAHEHVAQFVRGEIRSGRWIAGQSIAPGSPRHWSPTPIRCAPIRTRCAAISRLPSPSRTTDDRQRARPGQSCPRPFPLDTVRSKSSDAKHETWACAFKFGGSYVYWCHTGWRSKPDQSGPGSNHWRTIRLSKVS